MTVPFLLLALSVPCEGRVAIHGDEELALRLRAALKQRSIVEDDNCSKEVSIERDDQLIILSLRDEERLSVRHMTSMSSSAVVVESWLRDDLALPLLTPRSIPPRRIPFRAEEGELSSRTVEAEPERRGFEIALSGGVTVSSDLSLWAGGAIDGCYPIDFVCLGLVARFGADTGPVAKDREGSIQRLALDFALLAETPFELGGVRLSPGLEIGVNWLRTVRYTEFDDVDIKSTNLAIAIRLGTHIPVTDAIGFGVSLRAAAVPQAHVGTMYDDGVALPGEPRFYAGLSLGIEGRTR